MQSLDLSDLKNKKVILRVDFNVPIDEKGNVEDDTRIIAAKPSLDYLLRNQNKVILISYLGRPDKKDPKFSLKPIIGKLSELYPHHEIVFIEDFLEDDARVLSQTDKQIILFENIRFYPQEQKNDETYIKKIAHYADAYVNDAFSVSHRKESTVTGLPRFLPSYAGFQLEKEVSMLKKALGGKGSPRVTVLGGAKVSTKIHLIEKFITSSTYILLGGALANTFLATQGVSMGESLYENEFSNIALELLKKAQHEGCVILLPEDFIRGDGNAIVDIGPKTIEGFEKTIKKAHTIIWNGPMGLYEDPRYRAGSDKIFSAIAANHSALSIIGGGDTLLVLENKSEEEKSHISHISIGGGAMLEFIENGTLPGIEALDR